MAPRAVCDVPPDDSITQAEGTAALAIDAIEAAAWLLDQLGPGELGFLRGQKEPPPCWIPDAVAQSGDAMADTLAHIAIKTIARETQALREAVRILHPKVFA